MKPAIVYWVDSNALFGWESEDVLADVAPNHVVSVGFVTEYKDTVVVVQSQGMGQVHSVLAIPKRSVNSIKYLKAV